ncbi:MAG: S8 family serine peptidase [Verrucomicrobiales bacterium]|nr:S8 family serine peptidase [Verrucomicrobiales bacterium]
MKHEILTTGNSGPRTKSALAWCLPAALLGIALQVQAADLSSKTIIDDPTAGGVIRVALPLVEMEGYNDVLSSNPSTFTGININEFLGADTFYDAGYTGSGSVVANVEAGHIWDGHETLGHVTTQIDAGLASPNGDYDLHATWVGGLIGGRLGGAAQGEWQRGIAYGADLWSGAIATAWTPPAYSLGFSFTAASVAIPYNTVFASGVAGRTADVVNSSWGFSDPTGYNSYAGMVDALVNQNPTTTMVASAGNSGPDANTVGGIAAGHNVIAVAALGPGNTYDAVTSFSSRGPSPYRDVNGEIAGVRATVDIAAPGENLTGTFYGGTTGGNTGGTAYPGANLYYPDIAGTSFAAPIVAGGAALLTDAAYTAFPANPSARDNRVVKAVLLNSADKIAGWDNGQALNGGVVETFQSLDLNVGAGRMNLAQAYTQFLLGTADVSGMVGGTVQSVGWDYAEVSEGSPTDYVIDTALAAGSQFTATLTWNRDRTYNFNETTGGSVTDDSFDDLDLEIWTVVGGLFDSLVAISQSTYNNVEHLSFSLPATGEYGIRVTWAQEIFDSVPGGDVNTEQFGLAWYGVAVPEPAASAMLAGAALVLFGIVRRRRSVRQSV